jgi:ribonuclease D
MSWQLVESDAALAELLGRFADCEAVMVDTEFMRRNTFYPQVALLQLCFANAGDDEPVAWLVDPLRIEDTWQLRELFVRPGIIKVLHSASEDLEVFQRWLGVLPTPLFDTQRAAALLNVGFGMGYRALVGDITGVDLPKGEQRSDWLRRPLTQSQCEYAAQDVSYLLPVWRELHSKAIECERMDWILADGFDAVTAASAEGEGYHTRIKSAWKLDRRQLAALAAICRWREQVARERDKPRSWIIDDKTCLELARRNPRNVHQLRALELPPPVLRRYAEQLLDILAAQGALPEGSLPARLPQPLDARQRDALKRLKARGRDLAGELAMAPEILLPGKDYELLLREDAGEDIAVPAYWLGWRGEAVVTPLRASLAGGPA